MRLLAAILVLSVACAPAGTAGSAGASGSTAAAPDPANATFKIGGDNVTLANGRAERDAAPGSATKTVTTLTDKRASGDVDGDGRPDTIVVLIHQPGGTGSFYYLAALLNTPSGTTVTPAVLLGDRVVVNAVRLDARTVVVDMLDRPAGQPLTASPTVTATKRFVVDRGTLAAQ